MGTRDLGEGLYQRTELEDKSEKNYCIRAPAEEAQEPYLTVRQLQPINTKVERENGGGLGGACRYSRSADSGGGVPRWCACC